MTNPDGLFLGVHLGVSEVKLVLIDTKFGKPQRRYWEILNTVELRGGRSEQNANLMGQTITRLVEQAYEHRGCKYDKTMAVINRACLIYSEHERCQDSVWRQMLMDDFSEYLVGPGKLIISCSEVGEEVEASLLAHRFCMDKEITVALFLGVDSACKVIEDSSEGVRGVPVSSVNPNSCGSLWIAKQAVLRMLGEDVRVQLGKMQTEKRTTNVIEQLYLDFFNVSHIHRGGSSIWHGSRKYQLAGFTDKLANEGASCPVVTETFYRAGQAAGQLINAAASRVGNPESAEKRRTKLSVLLSANSSIPFGLLYDGLKNQLLQNKQFSEVEVYKKVEKSAVCAAVQAASEEGVKVEMERPTLILSLRVVDPQVDVEAIGEEHVVRGSSEPVPMEVS